MMSAYALYDILVCFAFRRATCRYKAWQESQLFVLLLVLGDLDQDAGLLEYRVQHLSQVLLERLSLLLGHVDVPGHAQQQPLELSVVVVQRVRMKHELCGIRTRLQEQWGIGMMMTQLLRTNHLPASQRPR